MNHMEKKSSHSIEMWVNHLLSLTLCRTLRITCFVQWKWIWKCFYLNSSGVCIQLYNNLSTKCVFNFQTVLDICTPAITWCSVYTYISKARAWAKIYHLSLSQAPVNFTGKSCRKSWIVIAVVKINYIISFHKIRTMFPPVESCDNKQVL